MPPKSTKRSKNPFPKAAKKAKAAEAPCPLPTVTEENRDPIGPTSAEAAASESSSIGREVGQNPEVANETPAEKSLEEELERIEEEEVIVEKVVEVVKGAETVETPAREENAAEAEPEEEEEEEEEPNEQGEREEEMQEDQGDEVENGSGDARDGGLDEGNNVSNDETDAEENEENGSTMYMESKKQKKFEIFVGGLEKGAVEEDLIKIFGEFGDIESVRIAKNAFTQKSKGFAFIRYTSVEHTNKALAELKDGIEVKGKRVRVSASQDNDTLYLGNICKTWTRDQVLETLKCYGVEQIEDILLPDDPNAEGEIKGFAFLEFNSHSDAMTAFHRLRKPDAVFGCDRSAKVAFSQTSLHPNEEDLLQVKTVYIEGIPNTWDEPKIEELCKQYGEIEKIQLSRNFASAKRQDFGFVEFTSRDSAAACIEGISNAQLGEGVNVKVDFAKPLNKSRLAKKIARGGFKLEKEEKGTEEAEISKKRRKGKSKVVLKKQPTQSNMKKLKKNVPSKSQDKSMKEEKVNQMKQSQSVKQKKRSRKGMDINTYQEPSKKARHDHISATSNQHQTKIARNKRMNATTGQLASKKERNNRNHGKGRGRHPTTFANPRNPHNSTPRAPYPTTYAKRYPPAAISYSATDYAGSSGSKYHPSDLAPHAGYVPAAEQVRGPYENLRRVAAYDTQPRIAPGYAGESQVQSTYSGYPSYAGYETGYTYPSGGYPSTRAYTYRGAYY